MLALMIVFCFLQGISGYAAPGSFAPVEEDQVVQKVSEREGLERAETRFTQKELTQVLIKSGTDNIKTDVSSALNSVNSRYEKGGSDFIVESVQSDKRGNTHVRVVQQYKGIMVVGAEMNIILKKDRTVLAVTGFYAPGLKIDIEPKKSANDVINVITRDIVVDSSVINGPDLVIFGGRLAYSVIALKKTNDSSVWKYYIEANTGSILAKYSDIKY